MPAKFLPQTFLPSLGDAIMSAYVDYGFYPKRDEDLIVLQTLERKAWDVALFYMELANLRFDFDEETKLFTLSRNGYFAAFEMQEKAENAEWEFLRKHTAKELTIIYNVSDRTARFWLSADRLPKVGAFRGSKCAYEGGELFNQMKNNNHSKILGAPSDESL